MKRPTRPQHGPIGSKSPVMRRLDGSMQLGDAFLGRVPFLNGQLLRFSTTGEQEVKLQHGMVKEPQGFVVIGKEQDQADPTKTNWKVWVY